MTEVRGQMTDDGGQKTEIREQKNEVGKIGRQMSGIIFAQSTYSTLSTKQPSIPATRSLFFRILSGAYASVAPAASELFHILSALRPLPILPGTFDPWLRSMGAGDSLHHINSTPLNEGSLKQLSRTRNRVGRIPKSNDSVI